MIERYDINHSVFVVSIRIVLWIRYLLPLVAFCVLQLQAYKEWILRMIEETWNLFRKKFVALWELHKDGPGEAYLPAIYNNPELQQLVQNKYLTEVFHDSLGFGAAKMIRFSPLLFNT